MICPHCGYENRDGAHFCLRCGNHLAVDGSPAAGTTPHPTRPLDAVAANVLPETRPLPSATLAFAPLPEGALLHNGRYAIIQVLNGNGRMNIYRVQDSQPTRLCPNCQTPAVDAAERFCALCGADLSTSEPLYLRYRVHESADEQAFAVEARLLEMDLHHPGLLLPHDIFAEAPYGPQRRYRVEAEFSPTTANSLPMPQELNRVLEWGVSLAQALDFLHRHDVALGEIGLPQIAIEGKEARWTRLESATLLPAAPRTTSARRSQDVRGLVAALFSLVTEQPHYTPVNLLPEDVGAFFAQVLASSEKPIDAATVVTLLQDVLETQRHPSSVILLAGLRSDVGQQRSLNEDSLLTLGLTTIYRSVSTPVGLYVVADGMGGHEAGDVASQTAIRAVAQCAVGDMMPPLSAGEMAPDVQRWLLAAVQAANRAVYDRRQAAGSDMGTTLVAAFLFGDRATIANIGDSRAYLLTAEGITQITTDHSLVERLVATGQISRQEAHHHPQRNVIYRVVGDRANTEADTFQQRLGSGQAVLLCSDGLSGMVPDERMWNIWRTSTSPQEACDRLVQAANDAGGEDNITVIIVQVA